MDLLTYLHVIQYRKQAILIVTLFTVAAAVIGRTQMPVKYESAAIIRVVPYSSSPTTTQIAYADRIMRTYVEIGSSSVIMSDLRKKLGLTPDRPASVDIQIISGTELLQVTVADYDPVLATDVTAALVDYMIKDNSIRDVNVTLMEPASIPKPPSNLSLVAFYVLAVLVGLLGGLGVAFLLENIDPRLYDEKQLENLAKLSVLGGIPSISSWQVHKLVARRFPFNHAFRRLGINLQPNTQERKVRTILVTSPEPREGKSTVAANLACSLAKSGNKTILVDLDMYRPNIHRYFRLHNEHGLNDILFSNVPPEKVVHETNLPGLWVIIIGGASKGLEEFLLDKKQIEKLLAQLTLQYDYVILDAPALLGLSDSMMLSTLVDGVLLVTRLGVTRQAALTTACRELERLSPTVLGVVINQSTEALALGHYHISKWRTIPLTRVRWLLDLFHRVRDSLRAGITSKLKS